MSVRELLIRETEEIPETLAAEALDFLRFVKRVATPMPTLPTPKTLT